MTQKERQEQIERWATYIIPAVFVAENAVKKKQPEWIKKLQDVTAETKQEVSDAYCRAIAEEIVNNSQ